MVSSRRKSDSGSTHARQVGEPQFAPVHKNASQGGVLSKQRVQEVLQRKAGSTQAFSIPRAPRTPTAPAVYRPQVGPRVLQSKTTAAQAGKQSSGPPVTRSNPKPGVLQAKINEPRPETPKRNPAQRGAAVPQKGKDQSIVQPFASRVVQAVKLYPNLHPGAVEPVDHGNVFRLNSFANQYRLHKVNSHGVNVPNQQYNFVRTREGEMLLHARYRHPSIAEGKQVLYAGEISFNNGQLEWWSNGSGHYQPYAEDAEQANLPLDHFYSFQQIIKGEHKRKRS